MSDRIYQWSYFSGGGPDLDEDGKNYIRMQTRATRNSGNYLELADVCCRFAVTSPIYMDGSPISDSDRKKLCPAISGAIYPDGAGRGWDQIESVNLLILDVDSKVIAVSQQQIQSVLDPLGYAYILYHSYSSAPFRHRMRVILPLARAVKKELWRQYAHWAVAHLGLQAYDGAIDMGAVTNAAAIYYLAGSPSNQQAIPPAVVGGNDLDVPEDEVIGAVVLPADRKAAEDHQQEIYRSVLREIGVDVTTLDGAGLLRAMGYRVGREQSVGKKTLWKCECPWSAEHSRQEKHLAAWISQEDGHWTTFGCFHDACRTSGRDIIHVMALAGVDLTRKYAERYEKPTELTDSDFTQF